MARFYDKVTVLPLRVNCPWIGLDKSRTYNLQFSSVFLVLSVAKLELLQKPRLS
jgi:hypothetical protein